MPIPWEADNKTLSALFNSVNGLLLPGGYHPIYKHSKSPSFDNNKLAETTAFLIKKAIKANRKGKQKKLNKRRFFPCLWNLFGP